MVHRSGCDASDAPASGSRKTRHYQGHCVSKIGVYWLHRRRIVNRHWLCKAISRPIPVWDPGSVHCQTVSRRLDTLRTFRKQGGRSDASATDRTIQEILSSDNRIKLTVHKCGQRLSRDVAGARQFSEATEGFPLIIGAEDEHAVV